jgi:hypothetical protein
MATGYEEPDLYEQPKPTQLPRRIATTRKSTCSPTISFTSTSVILWHVLSPRGIMHAHLLIERTSSSLGFAVRDVVGIKK